MQLLLALSALLVVPVLAATVRSSPDKRITLDISNAPVAPDGFTRTSLTNGSMRLSTSIDFDGFLIDTPTFSTKGLHLSPHAIFVQILLTPMRVEVEFVANPP
ncbi:hypothetical protein DFH09DRAFT_1334247 [Mycena vulgaris]|nr:hypothetical protein DFH09DRAFT_1334247 [Mycena vulgaris]